MWLLPEMENIWYLYVPEGSDINEKCSYDIWKARKTEEGAASPQHSFHSLPRSHCILYCIVLLIRAWIFCLALTGLRRCSWQIWDFTWILEGFATSLNTQRCLPASLFACCSIIPYHVMASGLFWKCLQLFELSRLSLLVKELSSGALCQSVLCFVLSFCRCLPHIFCIWISTCLLYRNTLSTAFL